MLKLIYTINISLSVHLREAVVPPLRQSQTESLRHHARHRPVGRLDVRVGLLFEAQLIGQVAEHRRPHLLDEGVGEEPLDLLLIVVVEDALVQVHAIVAESLVDDRIGVDGLFLARPERVVEQEDRRSDFVLGGLLDLDALGEVILGFNEPAGLGPVVLAPAEAAVFEVASNSLTDTAQKRLKALV